jgi:hypothetical protein
MTRPAEGKRAGWVMPSCDTEAMPAHLAATDAQAVLALDQAGGRLAGALDVPGKVTPPPRSPGLNPVETVWPSPHATTSLEPRLRRLRGHPRPPAAPPGTSSSTGLGASDPSDDALGRKGSDQGGPASVAEDRGMGRPPPRIESRGALLEPAPDRKPCLRRARRRDAPSPARTRPASRRRGRTAGRPPARPRSARPRSAPCSAPSPCLAAPPG